jgi:outer membrane protein OmpA-like peptidoglycan-associated protein
MKPLKLILLLLIPVYSLLAQGSSDTSVIFFDYDKSEITNIAQRQLQRLIQNFTHNPGNIQLYGHCDSKGSHEYNDKLSERRTLAVQEWLIANNVPAAAITMTRGFGKREPLNDNADDEERSLNRRVEIIITRSGSTAQVPAEAPRTFSSEVIKNTKEGEKLVLPQLNFQGGLHRFMPSALPSLKELLEVMKNRPTLEIEIQGHICCLQGTVDGMDMETGRYDLSTARAKAVYDYLVENGIEAKRMRYKGLAGQFPIVMPELSEADRTTNRRVEILILKQ